MTFETEFLIGMELTLTVETGHLTDLELTLDTGFLIGLELTC